MLRRITFFRPTSVCVGSGVHSATRKLDREFLEHGLRLEIGGPERDGLAVPERPVVNDLDDRVGPSNADVEYRHDVAILGNDVVVAEPCEIEHVGNIWQYVITEERCPDVSTAPGKVVGRGYCEVGMQMCREAREVALDSRLEILIHPRLVSLVLGLKSHVYSLWVAVTKRACRRRHAFKNRVACSTKSSGYWWCAP